MHHKAFGRHPARAVDFLDTLFLPFFPFSSNIAEILHRGTMGSSAIVDVILSIPRGKVATYGQVVRLAGRPRGARLVAWTLHSHRKHPDLPWYRIVNARGGISLRRGDGYELQKEMLTAEGVIFGPGDRIDLSRFQWQPGEEP
jgi:methylated-DNA-protein-cysteine methyltransferase-like protein